MMSCKFNLDVKRSISNNDSYIKSKSSIVASIECENV